MLAEFDGVESSDESESLSEEPDPEEESVEVEVAEEMSSSGGFCAD